MTTEDLDQWSQIHEIAREHTPTKDEPERGPWLYRGHADVEWELKTSLERCCDRVKIDYDMRRQVEIGLEREFRRAYHQYAQRVPHRESIVEWLALMQHHGAPTRLLDFTYSIYIAAYFALEGMGKNPCVVWAVRHDWARDMSSHSFEGAEKKNAPKLRERDDPTYEATIRELLFEEPFAYAACPVNPFHLNERLRTQKGVFLAPGDVNAPFEVNLKKLDGWKDRKNVVKIVIPPKMRDEALRSLFQMNVTRTSLFPGLDGYATSLAVYHPTFDQLGRY